MAARARCVRERGGRAIVYAGVSSIIIAASIVIIIVVRLDKNLQRASVCVWVTLIKKPRSSPRSLSRSECAARCTLPG